jgi:hypothetical protein
MNPTSAPATTSPVIANPPSPDLDTPHAVDGAVLAPFAAWRDRDILQPVLDHLVASAEPAVAFSSLAASCVPTLVDDCLIRVGEQPHSAGGRAEFTIRYPNAHQSEPHSGLTPDRSSTGSSVLAGIKVPPESGQPGYQVTVIFTWFHARRIEAADHVIAALLVQRVTDRVSHERLRDAMARAQDQATNLAEAVDSNRRIGQALGILMISYKLTDQQAFDLLRGVSQHTHRKLRDIADDVCHTGSLDLTRPAGMPPNPVREAHEQRGPAHRLQSPPDPHRIRRPPADRHTDISPS